MANTNLRFYFHGGQSSVFADLSDEVVNRIFEMLSDSRVESITMRHENGQQWINKSGIITVFPEVAKESHEKVEPISEGSQPVPESNQSPQAG